MARVKIYFAVNAEVHYDKASKAWIYHNRRYSISGYGGTRKKAKEMFFYCMDDILTFQKPKNNDNTK